MQLKKLKKKSFLVVELQPCMATCSIVGVKNNTLSLIASASIKGINPLKAVEQGLQQLSEATKNLPKQVVMLSSEVITGWVDLTVPSNLTEAQTTEMLRWELEGNLEGFGAAPSIENLLFYSAYLDQDQKGKVFEKADEVGFDSLVAARNFGILSAEEITQFETFVSEFPDVNQDYMIACAAPSKLYPTDKTLVSAMPMDYVREWVEFYAPKKMELLATYGLSGLTYAAIDSKVISGKSSVFLDSNTQQIQATYIKASKVVDTVVYPLSPTEISPDLVHDMGMHCSEFIHLGNTLIDFEEISTLIRAENADLNVSEFSLDLSPSLGLVALGAMIGNTSNYPIPELKTVAPPIPFYKKTQLYWTLCAGLFLSFALGYHVHHYLTVSELEGEIKELEIKRETKEIALSENSGDNSEALELIKEQTLLEDELISKRIDLTPKDRADFYSASLQAISLSITDMVDLKYLRIDRQGNITARGHSLSEPDVYTFSADFNKQMFSWELRPQRTDSATDPDTGIHKFTIVPRSD